MLWFVLWIIGSAVVGLLGRKSSVGFLGFFAFSLVFSPITGALSLLVAGPSREGQRKGAVTRPGANSRIDDLATTVRELELLVRRQEAEVRQLRCQMQKLGIPVPPPSAARTDVIEHSPVN